jgi:hypothetical protein
MSAFRVVLVSFALATATLASYVGPAIGQQQLSSSSSQAQVQDWLNSLASSGTTVTNDDIEFDQTNDLVTLKNLIIRSTATSGAVETNDAAPVASIVKVDLLSLKGFKLGPDGSRFLHATAEGIDVANTNSPENGGLKVSRLEIVDGFVPSLGKFTADPARPVSSQISFLRLLGKAKFGSIVASGFEPATGVSIETAALTDIANGKISMAEISGMRGVLPAVAAEDGLNQAETSITSRSIGLKNVNLDPYMRLFEASAYLEAGSSKPWSNLVEEVTVTGATFERGAMSFSFGKAMLGPFKIRQFDRDITALFDASAADPNFLVANPQAADQMATAIRGSFAFGAASIDDFKLALPNNNGIATLTLKAGSLANLTAHHVDQLRFDAVNFSDAGGSIAMRQLELGDVNLPVPPQGEGGANASSSQAMSLTAPTIGHFAAVGVDARVGNVAFGLEKLDLAMSYFIGATPTNVKLALDHLKFSTDQIAIPGLKQTLTDLGYKDLDLSFNLSGAWQDSASALAFDSITLSGAQMGTLSVSGSLTGITRASFENPRAMLPQEAAAGGIQNLRISFENDTLFNRFIEQAAKQNNKGVDELKRVLSANMSAILAQVQPPSARNKFTFAAVSFINNPEILQILTTTSDVTPVETVVNALKEPHTLPAVLKLDASANSRK